MKLSGKYFLHLIFTVRKNSCGKVMFSQVVVGHVWQGMAEETVTAADGTHPNEMHSCSTKSLSKQCKNDHQEQKKLKLAFLCA